MSADVSGAPLAPYVDVVNRGAKAMQLYLNPPRVEVGETPADVVWKENKVRVLRYRPLAERRHKTPIVIVYALVNRPTILDLQPDRSVVHRLLEGGHDVYLIDWGSPTPLDRHLTLDDYVNRYIHNAVRAACREAGTEDASILGYCMGGAMAVMYASFRPERVRALALMAAPLDFSKDPSLLKQWAAEEHFDVDTLTDALGNIPPEFLNGGFSMLKPFENTMGKLISLYQIADDPKAVENYFRMEKWLAEGPDLPGETYRQYIKDLYQRNRLAEGTMEIGGRRVALEALDMPVCTITGLGDHLVPAISTEAFVERLPNATDKTKFEAPSGHIGLSVSSRSHRDLWPRVVEWFARHAEPA
ncbi:MAG TPA: class III poly(R)-hydroxyalkanoic acid synthase subunit PhaC [Candidatus Thermoplasmatota archaeon]|nr:class III poly(R)-hydroxyalkanoic acid synthase subunit PhaC [Candidatus Thermoplasmatota archaeon]